MHGFVEAIRPTRRCITAGSAVFLWSILSGGSANAAYIVTFAQVGANVVATGSGSVNLGGFTTTTSSPSSQPPNVAPGNDSIALGLLGAQGPADLVDNYSGGPSDGNPTSFGTGTGGNASSSTGSYIEYLAAGGGGGGVFVVPGGYVSGSALGTSTDVFSSQTFSSLGLAPGTTVFHFGSGANADTFTLVVPGAAAVAVPEPDSVALLALGAVAIALVRRRRSPWAPAVEK